MEFDQRLQRGRNGNPVYDWTINDKIFDAYIERGVKPYAQIGFMPEALSTHPQNYPHNPPVKQRAPAEAGQAYPPKDYVKWGNLSYEWAKHCVEKYGADEVRNGIGRSGMSRTSVIGTARVRNISNSTIMPWTACGARCRTRALAGRRSLAGRAELFCAIFSTIARRTRIMSRATSVRRWTSFRFTQKARPPT